MQRTSSQTSPTTAILILAEIKAAAGAFDRGDSDVFDALDAIVVAVESYQAARNADAGRESHRRDAA